MEASRKSPTKERLQAPHQGLDSLGQIVAALLSSPGPGTICIELPASTDSLDALHNHHVYPLSD